MTLAWAVLWIGVLLFAGFGLLIGRLFRRTGAKERGAEWLSDFSIENYRPMERLLRESDYEFLAAQRGFEPRIAWELRAERREIFHGYLWSLIRDFNTLTRMARLFAVHAKEDRSDYLRAIFWMQVRFYCLVAGAEARLVLAPLPVGKIDIRALIGHVGVMRENLGGVNSGPHEA